MDWQADFDEQESEGNQRETEYCCPYCWEWVSPPLEDDLEGELIWDCEVCCRPWLISIETSITGERQVEVRRAQNG